MKSRIVDYKNSIFVIPTQAGITKNREIYFKYISKSNYDLSFIKHTNTEKCLHSYFELE